MITAIASRDNDFEHWVKCRCGWEGFAANMRHDYAPLPPDDVTPMDYCPNCGKSIDNCEVHDVTKCPKCGVKLEHFSGLEQIPEYLYCPVCNDTAYDYDGKELFKLI